MIIRSLDDVPATTVAMEGAAGALKQLVLGSADGVPSFSFRVFTIAPGGHTPYHRHRSEHLNYIIAGRGVLIDGEGDEHPLQAGDFALILPDEMHQYRNTGDEPLQLICAVPKQYE